MTRKKYIIIAAVAILAGAYFNQYPTTTDTIAAVASAAVGFLAARKAQKLEE